MPDLAIVDLNLLCCDGDRPGCTIKPTVALVHVDPDHESGFISGFIFCESCGKARLAEPISPHARLVPLVVGRP